MNRPRNEIPQLELIVMALCLVLLALIFAKY